MGVVRGLNREKALKCVSALMPSKDVTSSLEAISKSVMAAASEASIIPSPLRSNAPLFFVSKQL